MGRAPPGRKRQQGRFCPIGQRGGQTAGRRPRRFPRPGQLATPAARHLLIVNAAQLLPALASRLTSDAATPSTEAHGDVAFERQHELGHPAAAAEVDRGRCGPCDRPALRGDAPLRHRLPGRHARSIGTHRRLQSRPIANVREKVSHEMAQVDAEPRGGAKQRAVDHAPHHAKVPPRETVEPLVRLDGRAPGSRLVEALAA